MAVIKPPKPIPPEPEVDPGIIRRAANAGLGGISALGNLLGLPGSMVLDTLSLRNPFDQLLTPLSPDNRTTGREFLRNLGLIGKKDTWANLVPGMAVEIATDPLTYLSLGTSSALKPGGQAAKAAGILGHAPDIATARQLSSPTQQASKAMKVANVVADAVRADEANPLIQQAMKRGAVPSGVPRGGVVGPRMARTKMSLNELVAGLPEKHVPGDAAGVLREQAVKRIDNYAQKVHGLDYSSFMEKHGNDTLAGHYSVGVPFGTRTVGELPAWTKIDSINAHLDAAGEYLRWSAPGRAVSALFHAPAMGQFPYEGQKIAGKVYENRKAAVARTAEELWKVGLDMEDLSAEFAKHYSGRTLSSPIAANNMTIGDVIGPKTAADSFGRLARYAYEISGNRSTSDALSEATAKMLGTGVLGDKELHEKVAAMLDTIKTVKDKYHADLLDSGIDIGTVGNSLFSHLPRYVNPQNFDEYKRYVTDLVPMGGLATKARTKEIAELPAEAVEWLVSNPYLRDPAIKDNLADQMIGDALRPHLDAMTDPPKVSDIRKWLRTTSGDFAFGEQSRRFYPNAPIKDLKDHLTSAARITATRDAAFHTILQSLDDVAKNGAQGSKLVNLDEVLSKMSFGNIDKAKQRLAKMAGLPDLTHLDNAQVPEEIANALGSIMTKTVNPSAHGPLLFWYDKATQLLKTALTLPWPAFSVRNSVSGQLWNLMSPALADDTHYGKYYKNLTLARDMAANPQNHRETLAELDALGVYRYGANSADVGSSFHSAGVSPPNLFDYRGIVDTADKELQDSGRTFIEHALRSSPPAQEMAGKVLHPIRRGYGVAVEAGKRAAATGEWYNRVPMYLTLKDLGYAPEVAAKMVSDLHVDYSDLAPFEKDVMRRLVPFYCVPTDHEILTRDGWKTHDQLTVGEEVLGWNDNLDCVEWVPLKAVHVFPFDGTVMQWKTSRKHTKLSFQFTHDHRWPVEYSKQLTLQDGRVSKHRSVRWKTGHELCSSDYFIGTSRNGLSSGTDSCLSPRHAAILGWVVTDGYHRWKKNYCEMIVYQSPSKHLDAIVELLGTTPRNPHPQTGVVPVPVALRDVKAITRVFRAKRDLCGIIGHLDRAALESMYEAMMAAEGSTTPSSFHFAQSGPDAQAVVDAFQMICQLTGRLANSSKAGCYLRKRRAYKVHGAVGEVRHTGHVWCPETGSGSWIMRHNGCVVVTGNSFMRKIGENMFRQIAEHPHGVTSVAGTIKNMNRMRSPGELLPDYVAETASIPLGEDAQGNRNYITGFGLPFEDPLSFLGKGVRGGLLEGLSRLNPMLKAPLEYATGELFFQAGPNGGRELADADPLLGRTISNIVGWEDPVALPQAVEVGIANSPLARAVSTARQLFDPRKSLLTRATNLASGVRISTVSPASSDALLRDAVQQELRDAGSRQFVRSYIPENRKATMTPEQLASATRLEGALNTLAKRAKRRKELQENPPQ